jgi:hypothetical protein
LNQDLRKSIEQASTRWMLGGMAAMDRGEWSEAAGFFEKAGDLRDQLPWAEDAEAAWMVAAAWLNHGDVLMRMGDPTVVERAIHSFDKTIEAMKQVPLAKNPAFVERLILTWLNRAGACAEIGDNAGARDGFSRAEALLVEWGADVTPVRRFLAAMLRVNRSRLLLTEGAALDAWLEVSRGLGFLQLLEVTSETARAGIQARSLRCRALAMLLEEPGGPEKVGDWIAAATDSAEEALALVKTSGFRDEWVSDLVRYGAKIYQACQPHFLGEFLAEWLGSDGPLAGDEVLKKEMRNLLLLAQVEVERKVLRFPHDTAFVESQMKVLRSLQLGRSAIG